jgi:hypothetical protein
MFRNSLKGQRKKAQRDDYINRSLRKLRAILAAEQPPEMDFANVKENMSKFIASCNTEKIEMQVEDEEEDVQPKLDFSAIIAKAQAVAEGSALPTFKPKPKFVDPKRAAMDSDLEFPSGMIGDLANHFFDTAARPVRMIALVTAIGFFSGLVGRQYNISGVGLNQYLILLASTGVGKESIATGISKLIDTVKNDMPGILQKIGPGSFASGPALVKTMADKPCFLSILGEFGLTMQELCDVHASSAQVTLRKALLDIYMKSGEGSVLNSSVYSDKEKNSAAVESPALSILGESTPETFYEGLTESQISEGLLPRFSIYEYFGKRPYLNENLGCKPPKKLVGNVSALSFDITQMELNNAVIKVGMNSEVKAAALKFERDTTDMINDSDTDLLKKLWSRADLKIKKMAALLAVGNDTKQPVITMVDYNWARKQVEGDIKSIMARFEKGEVGHGSNKQNADLLRVVTVYFTKKSAPTGHKKMRDEGCISMKYLRNSLVNLASFKKDRRGGTAAFKGALVTAVEDGLLVEVPSSKAAEMFSSTAKVFAISNVEEQ